jgi:pyruvate/2-oxoglutarate dehydrogenase complex dihydrolipoamide acyltransferase (E2) component
MLTEFLIYFNYQVICSSKSYKGRYLMSENQKEYSAIPFPKIRQPIVDSLGQAKRMNVIHLLMEIDVTDARCRIRQFRKQTGEPLSFTAFLTFCLARAIDENKLMHAYRQRSKLIIFEDIDISVLIERKLGGEKAPIIPHIIKAANKKGLREIHDEIRAAQAEDTGLSESVRWMSLYSYVPGFIRNALWRRWLGSPFWRKKLTGTVAISSVGMFGKGAGWGIPVPTYNLSLTVGGISKKPGVVFGNIEVREYLCLTASVDHNIIDGAPAARFAQRLKELIESGYGLHA